MSTERELAASDKLERAIYDYLHETGMDENDDLKGMFPQAWCVMVGFVALDPNDDNGSGGTCHIPKEGQPIFTSLGLVTYAKARLEGLIMDIAPS